jgi:hypothetical protein
MATLPTGRIAQWHKQLQNPAVHYCRLSPSDHTLILIGFQSQMAFATKSIDPALLRNNAALVADAAKIFNVTTIPTFEHPLAVAALFALGLLGCRPPFFSLP